MGALIAGIAGVGFVLAGVITWALCRAAARSDEAIAEMLERFYRVDGSYGGTDDDEDGPPPFAGRPENEWRKAEP